MSCFKYIIFPFLTFLSLLYGEVWTDCSEAFEIAAQTVTLPSPAEIDYKAGLGKEFREALAGRKDINWNAVADNYREWSEHTTTLSGPARMLVACVLTVATNGLGTKWLASHGIAEGTATHAALSAGIQAVVVGAGTSFAGNLGDIGKTFDELTSGDFVKSLASTMLTAGISQSLSTSLQLPDEPKNFTESFKNNATHGLVRTGVDSAISGGNLGQNLDQNMTAAVVNAGASQVAHKIGDGKHSGALNPVTHKALHAGLGAASKALTGGDPVAGAIGAAASETAAEAMDKPDATPAERRQIAQKARLVGDTMAFVAGRDVASADSAGRNAVENNWWWTLDAYHYGKIYTERGKQGVVEEIKEHPVEAALAVGGLGFIGRIGKGAKVVGKIAKAEKLEQKTVQTGKTVTEAKAVQTGIGPYKEVGGHHPIQQAALKGNPKYNAQEVLAVSEERLAQYAPKEIAATKNPGKYVHQQATNAQRYLQKELLLSGRPNTMQEQVRIAWQAMVKAGIPVQEARDITAQAYWDLKRFGVTQPTRIPWSKK